ncbi:hypothetical protein B0H14DRAFT_3432710 [Mycena olivaceomarginata]|nr:hypothetical protein B0H14DRAFT_3432710 [Mycena olivaceomarginata]
MFLLLPRDRSGALVQVQHGSWLGDRRRLLLIACGGDKGGQGIEPVLQGTRNGSLTGTVARSTALSFSQLEMGVALRFSHLRAASVVLIFAFDIASTALSTSHTRARIFILANCPPSPFPMITG